MNAPTDQLDALSPHTLQAIRGGDKQADFLTGAAAGYAFDAGFHVVREHLAARFPRIAAALSWKTIVPALRGWRRAP